MKVIRKTRDVLLFILLIVSVAAGFSYSQNSNHNEDKNSRKDSLYDKAGNGIPAIIISPAEQERSGIVTERLKKTSHRGESVAYGSVISTIDLSADVQDYQNAEAKFAKSQEELYISQNNYDRTKSLYEKKLASEQDYQTSRATYLSDKAAESSAQSDLTGIKSRIVEQWGNVVSELIFNDSAELQNLLSLKETLIQISLPPGASNIKIPDKIFVISPKDDEIVCRFYSAGHLANQQFQTSTIYYITSNTSLSGGMNVKALLPEGNELTGIIVPSSSIVWHQGKAWAYIQRPGNRFIRVEIDTGNPAGTGFFIPLNNGILSPGNYIVTEGAQLLLSKELMPAQKNSTEDEDND